MFLPLGLLRKGRGGYQGRSVVSCAGVPSDRVSAPADAISDRAMLLTWRLRGLLGRACGRGLLGRACGSSIQSCLCA